MRNYVVSIVWVRPEGRQPANIKNTLDINVKARSRQEAFGKVYDATCKKYSDHQVLAYLAQEQFTTTNK